ncbi:MAG: 2-hydroxyacid dehydrogenase [Verrucomicrobiales bacterium]|jgi:D-lactate dehydrogenase|nr:2-hydroxyacid dehydrogenase [Verrucomicrobiales bacterium]
MKIAVFSTKPYDIQYLKDANRRTAYQFEFYEERLNLRTSPLAAGFEVVCVFVNDVLDAEVLQSLKAGGTRLVVLRSAGFNNVDLKVADELGISVRRVPAYSPNAVAEFAVGMILTLNRKIYRAYNRVRDGNFSLEGLLGFDLHESTVGLIGTGKIGTLTGQALSGFGCKLLGYDKYPNDHFRQIGGSYVELPELLAKSDIISLHCPLTAESYHMINAGALSAMKDGVMLINTSRGGLINAVAVTEALKSGKVGYLGLDVYEQEEDVFFEDRSNEIIHDDVLQRLLMFPNVVITSHQAFFTKTAMRNICETTVQNIVDFEQGKSTANELHAN